MDTTNEILNTNPRQRSSFLSILFFTYTIKLFQKGYNKPLEVEDLYNPLITDRCSELGTRLERRWKLQLGNKRNAQPSLLKALLRTFWPEYLLVGIFLAIQELVFRILQPVMLGKLLDYFTPGSKIAKEDAYLYAAIFAGASACIAILENHFLLEGSHTGIKLRSSCCSLMYKKALKLSETALSELVTGKLIHLLSSDVSSFDYSVLLSHYLWVSPLCTVIVLGLLWNEAGVPGIVGAVPILLIAPLQSYAGKLISLYRNETATKTDERIRLMDEIISGIQVIKMYAWEKSFKKLVDEVRKLELRVIKKLSYIRGVFMTISLTTTRIALFCALLTVSLSDQELTARKIFVLVCYFNILSINMSVRFVRGVSEIVKAKVSIRRIQDFLLYNEQVIIKPSNHVDSTNAVAVKNVTARWRLNSSQHALRKINFTVENGDLLGVVGPVGSGKSSLLKMLLGELAISSGDVEVNGTVSYACQEGWVFPATIRQNILFGQHYDRERYRKITRACALETDFKHLPHGDLSVVGDRGAVLSGGLKARISLARAMYRDADIYLLDDPLSAVDVAVAKHIYLKCINEFLANKTRILITHQVYHLKNATNIVIFNNGEIEMQGTFTKLTASSQFLSHSIEEPEEVYDPHDIKFERHYSITSKSESVGSYKSESSITDSLNQEKGKEVDFCSTVLQEQTSMRSVQGSLFFKYLSQGGNCCFVAFVIFLSLITQAIASGVDYFVSYWAKQEESKSTSTDIIIPIYSTLLISLVSFALIRSLLFYNLSIKSSQNLHNQMLVKVINSNMSFFFSNPSGRILNRFSKDISSVDEALPKSILDAGQTMLMALGSIILVISVKLYFLIPIGMIACLFLYARLIFVKTSKNIKRIEALTRSPVFAHLNSTLHGITTIRAFNAQELLNLEFEKFQDCYTSASFMYFTASHSFSFLLDVLSFIFTTFVTFSFLILEEDISGGDVGLAITQAVSLTRILQWGVRHSTETINQLIAVERVLEYKQIPSEEQPLVPLIPSEQWPKNGCIVLEDMGLRHSDIEPFVIRNLSLNITSAQKIGVVGRTGSGKCSLIAALLRLAIIEGKIKIDGLATSSINLQKLRSKISVIPQDPVLFSGTLRFNLDPLGEFPDNVLCKVLDEVGLKDPLNLINNLDYRVSASVANYSVGQRQLICLARALLRRNKILLLDEAIADIDPQTDAVIQKIIREKFADCTILTIAHRLNTIIDSDKVLVMDYGTMMEFDHAYLLLQNLDGIFYKMVLEAGSNVLEQFKQLSKETYERSK